MIEALCFMAAIAGGLCLLLIIIIFLDMIWKVLCGILHD